MDVFKSIGHSQHGDTLNGRRAANSLARLVAGERGGRPLTLPQSPQFPENWGGTELKHTVTCMVLKTKADAKSTSSPLP
ncbi:hypothetical protein TNCV_2234341 [Trichonephila clavipes]|nr:hypothetical protein TNCV_2234341 [Trichonephila clavipes]